MNARITRSELVARRAELLAEVLLQELDAAFIARPTTEDVGYDLLVGFSNEKTGINTFAVGVKSTERPVGPRFSLDRSTFRRIAHSNVPGILLVADVKQNRLYYAWLRSNGPECGTATVSVALTEVTDATKAHLRKQFRSANGAVAAAG